MSSTSELLFRIELRHSALSNLASTKLVYTFLFDFNSLIFIPEGSLYICLSLTHSLPEVPVCLVAVKNSFEIYFIFEIKKIFWLRYYSPVCLLICLSDCIFVCLSLSIFVNYFTPMNSLSLCG